MSPILAYEMFCEGFNTYDIAQHIGVSEAEVEEALYERRLGRRLISEYLEAIRDGYPLHTARKVEVRPQA